MNELRAFEAEAQRRGMGEQVQLLDRAAVADHLQSPLYLGALKNLRNLHLHPLNLCLGEARAAHGLGALIFENSEVLDIVHGPRPAVVTAHGRVEARQVMLAGDVYHKLEKRQLKGKIFPAMGGIVTTAPLGELAEQINPQDLAVYDCRFVLDYYRLTADKRLLFGGGANYSGKDSRDIEGELRPCIERTFGIEGGVDRVPVELRHGHRGQPHPAAGQAVGQRVVLPGLLGARHCHQPHHGRDHGRSADRHAGEVRHLRPVQACAGADGGLAGEPAAGGGDVVLPDAREAALSCADVGAGLPVKGPALLTDLHPPFAVVATTVFAGKPAPTGAQSV